MKPGYIVYDRHAVVCMQRLFLAFDGMCHLSGDVTFIEYVCLLNAAEIKDGVPLRDVNVHLGYFLNPMHYVGLLEEKELLERQRGKKDRRSFSLRVSEKGRTRIQLIDRSVAALLIDTEPRLTENAFEELVVRVRRLSDTFDPTRRVGTFFPGLFTVIAARYHQAVAQEAAYLGMTSLQIALLCQFDGLGDTMSLDKLARGLGIPADLVDLHMGMMVERRMVRLTEDGYELMENGVARLEQFWSRFTLRLDRNIEQVPEQALEYLEELGEFCVYTFA